jgi:hypothetical protein
MNLKKNDRHINGGCGVRPTAPNNAYKSCR